MKNSRLEEATMRALQGKLTEKSVDCSEDCVNSFMIFEKNIEVYNDN